MNRIVLFGAGKSATALIDYLLDQATDNNWEVVIADANKSIIEQKISGRKNALAVEMDLNDNERRSSLISSSDIVISMMPPALHILIARDCIYHEKHLLTASYADNEILALDEEVKNKQLLFLCEMGLDPGIDHMSAMKLLNNIKQEGGQVSSFKSH